MAKPFKRKGSKYWQIAPSINGVQVQQSSKTMDYEKAEAKIKILEGNLAAGKPIQPQTDRKDFASLLDLVRKDYKVKGNRSIKDMARCLDKHIIPAIGHLPSNQIRLVISDYIIGRREEGAANGTIENELAMIRRAFVLGKEQGLVMDVPHIARLPKGEPRQTAYSHQQIQSLIGHSTELLADLVTIYSFVGWRKNSLLALEWSQVDFAEGFISLRAEQTKNRKATRFPLIEPIREILERRKAQTDEFQKRHRIIVPWVFHRDGVKIKDFRKLFQNAREGAGLPGHTIHDFRRTAVRALHDLGYDVKMIMDMCGFKTEAMVHRYIGMTSDDRLREAGKALARKRGYPAS